MAMGSPQIHFGSNCVACSLTFCSWIGTESGKAPYPTWSTGTTEDGGDPDSDVWCPAECDTTLQVKFLQLIYVMLDQE